MNDRIDDVCCLFLHIRAKLCQRNLLPDDGEINLLTHDSKFLVVSGRAPYLSITESPHDTDCCSAAMNMTAELL